MDLHFSLLPCGRRRTGRQRMRWLDGIIDSMDMSWASSGSWWWTGKPGVLQAMELQRVRHDWATELSFSLQFSSVQSLSRVRLFATPWIAARQASLYITNSRSSLRLTSIKTMMSSSHLILGCPLLLLPPMLPASESFPMSQLFAWSGQSPGVSALASHCKSFKDQTENTESGNMAQNENHII